MNQSLIYKECKMLTDLLMYVLEKGITIQSGQKTWNISIGPSKASLIAQKAVATRLFNRAKLLPANSPELKLLPASRRQRPIPMSDILHVIRSRKTPMDRKEIAKKLGVTYNRLIRRMENMVKANQLKQIGNRFAA